MAHIWLSFRDENDAPKVHLSPDIPYTIKLQVFNYKEILS